MTWAPHGEAKHSTEYLAASLGTRSRLICATHIYQVARGGGWASDYKVKNDRNAWWSQRLTVLLICGSGRSPNRRIKPLVWQFAAQPRWRTVRAIFTPGGGGCISEIIWVLVPIVSFSYIAIPPDRYSFSTQPPPMGHDIVRWYSPAPDNRYLQWIIFDALILYKTVPQI